MVVGGTGSMRPEYNRSYTRESGATVACADSAAVQFPEGDLTEKIIGCAIRVHRELGPGYLESIYESALAHELRKQGLRFERQRVVKVLYDGIEVGEHRIDLFVEGKVALELKSVEVLTDKHIAQAISTLKAVKARVALLINFDESKVVNGIRRIVL